MDQPTKTTTNTTTTDHEKLIQARNSSRKEILDKMKTPEYNWLTENSRKFLESGYLTEGATPETKAELEKAIKAETE